MLTDLTTQSHAGHSGRRGNVERMFAKAAGISEAYAGQEIRGPGNAFDRVEKFILACRAARSHDLLDRRMRPLLELYFGITPQKYGPKLLQEAARAEARETVSRTDWQLGQERQDAYLRDLDRAIARMCELRESLAAR
jgi:hypothetical protein